MLSSALISELQEILREEFGLKLTDSEASATGESLVKVYETLGTITTRINHPTDDSKTIPPK